MGAAAGKAAVNIAKAGAKLGTTAVLSWAFPIVGSVLAGIINSLYAEGGDVQALNDKIKSLAPEGAKFKIINTPDQLKQMIVDFPKETKAAGLTADKIDKAVVKYENMKEEEKAIMAKGGMVAKKSMSTGGLIGGLIDAYARAPPPVKGKTYLAKGGAVKAKVKKPRSEAQQAATAKMLAALKASKGKK
jgi:hypothetical protein